jgi:hypothetical protein
MTKDKNLAILSEVEKFAFYGVPDFNDKQRREYFSFSESEIVHITSNLHAHTLPLSSNKSISLYCFKVLNAPCVLFHLHKSNSLCNSKFYLLTLLL